VAADADVVEVVGLGEELGHDLGSREEILARLEEGYDVEAGALPLLLPEAGGAGGAEGVLHVGRRRGHGEDQGAAGEIPFAPERRHPPERLEDALAARGAWPLPAHPGGGLPDLGGGGAEFELGHVEAEAPHPIDEAGHAPRARELPLLSSQRAVDEAEVVDELVAAEV